MNFPGTILDNSVQNDSDKFIKQQNTLLNSEPQPTTFGSYYKPSAVNPFSVPAQQQSNSAPAQTQTQVVQQAASSPKPFTGAGSTEYGSSRSNNLKTTNYKSFLDMLNSQKSKYIGVSLSSEPKTQSQQFTGAGSKDYGQSPKAFTGAGSLEYGSGSSDSYQSFLDNMNAGKFDNNSSSETPADSQETGQGTNWKGALTSVQQAADSLSKSQQTLARTEYESDVADWEQKGKYWFNVDSNLKPDLEKYMEGMPSSIDALKEGSWVTSLQDGNTDTAGEYLSSVFINPAGGKSGNDTADAILNPLNILEQQGWVDEGMVNYVGGKAAEGAISGGFVGALIGIVDGVFSWNSSKDEDAKRKKAAQEEYERKLQEWTFATNKRLADAATARNKEIETTSAAYRDKRKAEATTEKNQKISDIASARKEMATALLNAGTIKDKNRATRLARWGK
jgi:hypothetical protein